MMKNKKYKLAKYSLARELKVAARQESPQSFVNKDTRFIIFAGLWCSLVQSWYYCRDYRPSLLLLISV